MQFIKDKHEGNLRIDDDTEITGMVTGKVTVEEGCRLVLRGHAMSDVEVFGAAEIVGVVAGTVYNHGEVTIVGEVGALVEEHTGVTKVLDSGVIRDRQ